MNLLDLILNDSNGQLVSQLAKRAGVSESEIGGILEQVVPAVSRGMKAKMSDKQGLSSIMDILKEKKPERYLDQNEDLGSASVVDDGNSILSEIFGSKDTSREVASRVAKKTGTSSSIIKMLLPVVASLAMGALSKNSNARGSSVDQGQSSSGMMGMVKDFIDADDDGSIVDDLFSMVARRFF
jgi:hypothetical protein